MQAFCNRYDETFPGLWKEADLCLYPRLRATEGEGCVVVWVDSEKKLFSLHVVF